MAAATDSYVNGISGMRMMWAPLATPAYSAIQPASRPITSTTNTRLCEAAVVNRRSIDSVAISTAVLKPNVTSVRSRSLSMVLGTPMTRRPCFEQALGDGQRTVAADGDERVDAFVGESLHQLGGAVLVDHRCRRAG